MERYKAYSTHLKELYGEKVYKLPVNLPVTCPNRMDGDGCTFCGGVGTGFEAMNSEVSVSEQLNATKGKITKRYKAKKFIAYFQNYTNTFLPVDKFEKYLVEAAQTEDIVGISVSTRPDCITKEYLDCLKKISEEYQVKISMEYGLQTVNYKPKRGCQWQPLLCIIEVYILRESKRCCYEIHNVFNQRYQPWQHLCNHCTGLHHGVWNC